MLVINFNNDPTTIVVGNGSRDVSLAGSEAGPQGFNRVSQGFQSLPNLLRHCLYYTAIRKDPAVSGCFVFDG